MSNEGLRILNPKPIEKEWFSRKEAARYLASLGCPIAPTTLGNYKPGRGPVFYKHSSNIVSYRREDLDAWVRSRVRRIG